MFGITDFTKPIIDFSNFEFSQIGDAFLFGGSVLVIGMLAIFAILCLLWIFLVLFKIFFHDIPEKRAEKKKAIVTINAEEKDQVTSQTDEGEIIAVIAAAIAMAESEDDGLKFRVVSFRRV